MHGVTGHVNSALALDCAHHQEGAGLRPTRDTARHAARTPSRSWVSVLVNLLAAATGFALGWVGALTLLLTTTLNSEDVGDLVTAIPQATVAPPAGTGEPVRILIMGSDDRSGENRDIGGSDALGMRSDATMLVQVSGDRSRIDVVSIPRDLQVDIPTCTLFDGTEVPGGRGNLNAAFANGARQGNTAEAAACTINTVHDLIGVPIDHWVVVDFAVFITMVDALGGIPMDVPQRVVSTDARLDLEAGPQTLNGAQALGYARLRTAEVGDVSGSDMQRITRQQQLVESLLSTARSKNLLTDADELTSFVRAAANAVTTDSELARLDTAISLASTVAQVPSGNLTTTSVPWTYTPDRLRVELHDDAQTFFSDLRADRPLSVTAEHDHTSTWD